MTPEIMAQRRLNNSSTTIEMPQAFLDKFPDMKRDKANKLFKNYVDGVAAVLLPRLAYVRDGKLNVSLHDLLNECGEFQHNKVRRWVWNEFKDLYPFFNIETTGNNLTGKNSEVKLVNEDKLLYLVYSKTPEEVFDTLYDRDQVVDAERVGIDLANLKRYIGNTEYELTKSPVAALQAKLEHNLRQARLIEKVGQYTQEELGEALLPLIPRPSPYGRTYYAGMNIQTVSKQVRGAILGHHYQYDMQAAVFAIKLRLYGEIMGGDDVIHDTTHGTYTRQYIADKDFQRRRLAKLCFEGIIISKEAAIKAVKLALTAIGFGARATGTMWMNKNGDIEGSALTEVMKAPVARERFLNDSWVVNFLKEQRVIEDAIIGSLKASEKWPTISATVAAANKVNGRVKRSGILAWTYQQWETQVMDEAVAVVTQAGIPVVARIHDAFIVRTKLPVAVLDDIADAWGFRDYMTLDCDEVREWIEPSRRQAFDQADHDLAEHQRTMAGAQQQAALYAFRKARVGVA